MLHHFQFPNAIIRSTQGVLSLDGSLNTRSFTTDPMTERLHALNIKASDSSKQMLSVGAEAAILSIMTSILQACLRNN